MSCRGPRAIPVAVRRVAAAVLSAIVLGAWPAVAQSGALEWSELPPLPNPTVASVRQCNDAIVAGGANFPNVPRWESDKVWHAAVYVLVRENDGYAWLTGEPLPEPRAYGAAVSTPDGVLCMGGNNAGATFDDVMLLQWDSARGTLTRTAYPPLPKPCAFGCATLVANQVYLAGGQSGPAESAMTNFWMSTGPKDAPDAFRWVELPPWPGPGRACNIPTTQRRIYDGVYVISGRRRGEAASNSPGHWETSRAGHVGASARRTGTWPAPASVGARATSSSSAAPAGLFDQLTHSDALRFPKERYVPHHHRHVGVRRASPANQSPPYLPVHWTVGADCVVWPAAKALPRVRTPQVWRSVRRP